jgi:AraC-like DNA-binding protein
MYSCPDHGRRLRTYCHLCKHSLHPLGSHSRPGYCSVCQGWLGETQSALSSQEEAFDKSEIKWQRWAANRVGELLLAAPALTHYPLKAAVANGISHCIKISAFKNEMEFARNLKVPQSTLNDWRMGKHAPQLDGVLRLCFLVRVSLLDLILGRLPKRYNAPSSSNKKTVEQHTNARHQSSRRWTETVINEVKAILESALEENPPTTLIAISRRLGRSDNSLRTRFTALCRNIVDRHAIYSKEKQLRRWEHVRLGLEAAIRSEPPPYIQDVVRELGCSNDVLVQHFPELCERLSRLHQDRRRLFWEKVKLSLETALEDPFHPRTIRMIAKEMGCSYTSILNYFPDQCRQLASRYAYYRHEQFQQKKEQLRQKIRMIALEIYDEGKYPTVRRVSERLDQPRHLRSSMVGLAALREVCREINEGIIRIAD